MATEKELQDVLARMLTIARLMNIPIGIVDVHCPPPIDDYRIDRAVTWVMHPEGDSGETKKIGGRVIYAKWEDRTSIMDMLVRNFSILILRHISPSGEYENIASAAFCNVPDGERVSKKSLLADLVILEAKKLLQADLTNAIHYGRYDEGEIRSAVSALAKVLEAIAHVSTDIDKYRDELLAELEEWRTSE